MTTDTAITEQLATTRQVSDQTGIPEQTLRGWRSRGEGPPWFRLGRSVRYRQRDIDRWLAEAMATSPTADRLTDPPQPR